MYVPTEMLALSTYMPTVIGSPESISVTVRTVVATEPVKVAVLAYEPVPW
jgi:hypothetical protein